MPDDDAIDDHGASREGALPQGLDEALRAVLRPLARLALARGVTHAHLDELVKQSLVEAAREAHAGIPVHRSASRVSAATGLGRREVTRLLQPTGDAAGPRLSLANEVFARWLGDPALRDANGGLRRLPRLGRAPSFESLAQSVNRDVRPRAVLEELCRLGVARIDEQDDHVELLRDRFVPDSDERQMFRFLGANVGDHLAGAVSNVLRDGPRHLEQAVFADELSLHSLEQVRPVVQARWKALLQDLAPLLQDLIDADRAAGRPQDQRLRIGMYSFATGMDEAAAVAPADPDPAPPPKPRGRRSRSPR